MTKVLLVFSLLTCQNSFAGFFVDKSMYSPNYIVVGQGITFTTAERDARSAIPKSTEKLFYEPDSNYNSPAFQCSVEGRIWDEKDECKGADIQVIIPLRKVSR